MPLRPRIFYLARTVPSLVSGATLAMKRHFVDHDDVQLFIATTEPFSHPGIPSIKLQLPELWQRLKQTRYCRVLHNAEILSQTLWLPPTLIKSVRSFQPDAIFTVADLTLSEWARLLAKCTGIPLIVNFQDWWPRGQFYYNHEVPFPWLVPLLERRFARLYRQSALSFCTSEGMREFLGPHPNSHVLYPIGDKQQVTPFMPSEWRVTPGTDRRRKQLIYTGTAFGSYGRMLLKLADQLITHTSWKLVIYGKQPDWPDHVLAAAISSGLYRGFLPFDQLRAVLSTADACLSVMSFDSELELMMRTSFTTKVLDYCTAGRPIIMWGPAFCSPSRLIKKHQSGLTVTTPDPSGVLACLERLDHEPELDQELASQASWLAANILSHDNIHAVFINQINQLLENRRFA
jgi:glycosyltransferase involved in cell wall biosynthesis